MHDWNFNLQASQKGEIGITLVSHWMEPYSRSKLDILAKQRALDFMYGWWVWTTILFANIEFFLVQLRQSSTSRNRNCIPVLDLLFALFHFLSRQHKVVQVFIWNLHWLKTIVVRQDIQISGNTNDSTIQNSGLAFCQETRNNSS